MTPISPDLALRAARRACDAANVELVLPGDVRREAVVLALGAMHALSPSSGWSLAHARENVSVTLPSLGIAIDALDLIPGIGPFLSMIARPLKRDTILLAPSALRNGVTLKGVLRHELGHVGQIRKGGLLWCALFGFIPEIEAGAEPPCYFCDAAHEHFLGGLDIPEVIARKRESLTGYGIDSESAMVNTMLASLELSLSKGVDPTGAVAESVADLRAVGWDG